MRALVAIALVSSMGCNAILGISDPVAGNAPNDGGPDVDAGPRVLESISIEPDPLAVPLGLTKQLEARGHFSDGSTEDLTAQATFALVSGTSMTVTADGVVMALTEGPATISALVGAFTDMIDATVSTAAPDHITLSLGDLTMRQQQRIKVRATIVFTDGATAEGTNSVTWDSSDATIATVDTAGVVDAQLLMGAATISASLPSVTPGTLIANVGVIRCHPIINEVQAGSNGSAEDEWAEIFNPCTVAIDVSNFTLNYRAANDGAAMPDRNFLIQLAGTMQPGELRLYGGDMVPETLTATWGNGVMQGNNGGLGLRDGPTTTGTLVDSVTYGNVNGNPFTETAAAMGLDQTSVIARRPFDGNDTDNNSVNFVKIPIIASSPGVLNVP